MTSSWIGKVLTVGPGPCGETEIRALLAEHPTVELLDLRPARLDMDPNAVGLLKGFSSLRGLGLQGWDNFTGGVGDQVLRQLAAIPELDRLHLRYCMASIGTPPIFGDFPKLKRLWADYWCTDESDMLDDLKAKYPGITFLGNETNHRELDDREPSLETAP